MQFLQVSKKDISEFSETCSKLTMKTQGQSVKFLFVKVVAN